MLRLEKPAGLFRWMELYRLYRAAFPASERKPFSLIVRMYRRGKTDVWRVAEDGRFLGLAMTINGPDVILLDYFAMEPRSRGRGAGSAALGLLSEHYRDKGLFVEIESPYEDGPDRSLRLRRKAFYLANGMEPMKVMMRLFGVKMELLGIRCRLDYPGYRDFYRDNYGAWAAEHIREEIHPEGPR